jgi:hypothetical protein
MSALGCAFTLNFVPLYNISLRAKMQAFFCNLLAAYTITA